MKDKKPTAKQSLVTPKKEKNPGGRPEEYSLEFLEQELRAVNGKVYIAAKRIGCTSKVLYDYINRHAYLKEVVDDARSIIVDKAELALESAITEKQGWAVCFTLKTLGKDRGYVERSEITGKNGEPLAFDKESVERLIAAQMQEFNIKRKEAIADLVLAMPEITNYVS